MQRDGYYRRCCCGSRRVSAVVCLPICCAVRWVLCREGRVNHLAFKTSDHAPANDAPCVFYFSLAAPDKVPQLSRALARQATCTRPELGGLYFLYSCVNVCVGLSANLWDWGPTAFNILLAC